MDEVNGCTGLIMYCFCGEEIWWKKAAGTFLAGRYAGREMNP